MKSHFKHVDTSFNYLDAASRREIHDNIERADLLLASMDQVRDRVLGIVQFVKKLPLANVTSRNA